MPSTNPFYESKDDPESKLSFIFEPILQHFWTQLSSLFWNARILWNKAMLISPDELFDVVYNRDYEPDHACQAVKTQNMSLDEAIEGDRIFFEASDYIALVSQSKNPLYMYNNTNCQTGVTIKEFVSGFSSEIE